MCYKNMSVHVADVLRWISPSLDNYSDVLFTWISPNLDNYSDVLFSNELNLLKDFLLSS